MSYVQIPLVRLLIAAALITASVFVSWRMRAGLERDLLWGALRAAVQLIAIGYFLILLFGHERPEFVLGTVFVMLTVAAATSARRVAHGPGAHVLFPRALMAIGAGAVVALLPVFAWVIPPSPWYEARYLVPISGMMLSSAMNVVAQVFERLFATAHSDAATIEQWLALGASPKQALASAERASLRSAMIPTINGLLTVGLVALPGMMTGQIVSGTSPSQAVRYQIVIMYQIVAVAAVAGALATLFARRLMFTSRDQLRPM
jgi:putative ABC transport system permease protein